MLVSALLGAGLLAAPAPLQAKAIDATIQVSCLYPERTNVAVEPWRVQITGTVPDSTAPGQLVDLSGLTVKLDLRYTVPSMPTIPQPPAGTVYARLFDLTLGTAGATAPSAKAPGLPKDFPSATESTWGAENFDPSVAVNAVRATTAGSAPVVLRLASFAYGLETVAVGTPPPAGTPNRYECQPKSSAPPIAVIPSTGPVPGAPKITSISPDRGSVLGGTIVTIKGERLATATAVKPSFSSQNQPFTVVDDETITTTMPKAYGPYTDYLQVFTDFGETEVVPFVYTDAPPAEPTITDVSPRRAPDQGPAEITLTGTNLNRLEQVQFGPNALADVVEASADGTQARVRLASSVANRGAGKVDVRVKGIPSCIDDCLSPDTAADDFEFYDIGPQVWSVWKTQEPDETVLPGDLVTLGGFSLDETTGVRFGNVAAPWVRVLSDSTVQVLVPSGVTGKVRVTALGQPSGVAPLDTPSDEITVGAGGTLPVVGDIWGTVAADKRTLVAITGANLAGATKVRVGDQTVRPQVVAGKNAIWFFAPPLAKGSYPVTVTTPAGESQASLTKLLTYR